MLAITLAKPCFSNSVPIFGPDESIIVKKHRFRVSANLAPLIAFLKPDGVISPNPENSFEVFLNFSCAAIIKVCPLMFPNPNIIESSSPEVLSPCNSVKFEKSSLIKNFDVGLLLFRDNFTDSLGFFLSKIFEGFLLLEEIFSFDESSERMLESSFFRLFLSTILSICPL